MKHKFVARRVVLFALAVLALATPACMRDGRFDLLGYTVGSLHDTRYRTVYVPIFENKTFQSGPLRGLEYRLTEAVQTEIEKTTPYKVVSSRDRADTELLGAIVATPKHIINRNQLNEIREAQMDIKVELVWRDVRTCEILSKPSPTEGMNSDPQPEKPGQTGPLPLVQPGPPPKTSVTVIQASGHWVPELGESQSSALFRGCKRMAVQIVSLMEKPW